jgi:hypothetical protein
VRGAGGGQWRVVAAAAFRCSMAPAAGIPAGVVGCKATASLPPPCLAHFSRASPPASDPPDPLDPSSPWANPPPGLRPRHGAREDNPRPRAGPGADRLWPRGGRGRAGGADGARPGPHPALGRDAGARPRVPWHRQQRGHRAPAALRRDRRVGRRAARCRHGPRLRAARQPRAGGGGAHGRGSREGGWDGLGGSPTARAGRSQPPLPGPRLCPACVPA